MSRRRHIRGPSGTTWDVTPPPPRPAAATVELRYVPPVSEDPAVRAEVVAWLARLFARPEDR
jgi:hypothetical protein